MNTEEKARMQLREPQEIQSLINDITSTITEVQSYRNKSFKMQINPMIHTFKVLAFIEEGLQKAAMYLQSFDSTRKKLTFLFDEESERSMFNQLVSVQNYIHSKELSAFQKEYLAYKESLPTRDLEDIYGIVHLTHRTLEVLSERVDE